MVGGNSEQFSYQNELKLDASTCTHPCTLRGKQVEGEEGTGGHIQNAATAVLYDHTITIWNRRSLVRRLLAAVAA
eukprot:SAG31_NODE_1463_length_8238_cov_3.389851_12_plen_75_part_00